MGPMPLNAWFGWLWITLGFVSGAVIGLRFHKAEWLGGYGSLRRRLVRLGHISFFALGLLNVFFAMSAPGYGLAAWRLSAASWAFVVGAGAMPVCCGLMAWKRRLQPLFVVPVAALIFGGVTTTIGILKA